MISLATRSAAALQILFARSSTCSTRSLSRRTAWSTEIRVRPPLASPSDSPASENTPLGFATDASTTKTWQLIRTTSSKCAKACRRLGGTHGLPTKAPCPTCTDGMAGPTCRTVHWALLRKHKLSYPIYRKYRRSRDASCEVSLHFYAYAIDCNHP